MVVQNGSLPVLKQRSVCWEESARSNIHGLLKRERPTKDEREMGLHLRIHGEAEKEKFKV
jgi:hypothetical protein